MRIRGSVFFRDPERAMRPVFERLEQIGIPPEASLTQTASANGHQTELEQRVIRRARELLAEWYENDRSPLPYHS